MSKLSKLRRDIIRNPHKYSKNKGASIYRTKTGIKIFGTYYGRGYRAFIKKVLNELRQSD